jgi:flagellar motor switch protein FliN
MAPDAPRTDDQESHDAVTSGRSSSDIDRLLQETEAALVAFEHGTETGVSGVQPFEFRDFSGPTTDLRPAALDLLEDAELDLKVELGRSQMCRDDLLDVRRGSVLSLDKMAHDPADIFVNGQLIARGEVLVIDGSFCLRVTELMARTAPDAAA